MGTYTWRDGLTGGCPIRMTLDDAESCAQAGDQAQSVAALARRPDIAAQLAALDPEDVIRSLRETGGWDRAELESADPDANLARLLWVACCDIAGDPDTYRDDPPLACARTRDGKLPKYTSYGSKPIFYVDGAYNPLCADCANAAEAPDGDPSRRPIAADVNLEDPDFYCDACSKRIESAYAEPE